MPDPLTGLPRTPKRIGIAADHGGYELKEYLVRMLRDAGHEVIDFGDGQPKVDDDYPDFVVPLARAVARGEVERGVAICGSGVGASVVANKVAGVRACLIHESFSAHQGVEDDDLNMICLGGLVVAMRRLGIGSNISQRRDFSGAERHRRRLAKVADSKAGRHPHEGQAECDLRQVVLLRHGESVWNKENLFTGWTDVDLSDRGRNEGQEAGRGLKEHGFTFDAAFTSVLKRAIRTLWLLLDEMDLMWIPVHRDWRLNERHYGTLQGLNKTETAEKFGETQVKLWRRSYDIVSAMPNACKRGCRLWRAGVTERLVRRDPQDAGP